MPLAEAGETKGLSVDEVIGSLEAALAPLARGKKDWTKESLAGLAAHVVETHHACVTCEIARLNELAAKGVNRHGDTRDELPVNSVEAGGIPRQRASVHAINCRTKVRYLA